MKLVYLKTLLTLKPKKYVRSWVNHERTKFDPLIIFFEILKNSTIKLDNLMQLRFKSEIR